MTGNVAGMGDRHGKKILFSHFANANRRMDTTGKGRCSQTERGHREKREDANRLTGIAQMDGAAPGHGEKGSVRKIMGKLAAELMKGPGKLGFNGVDGDTQFQRGFLMGHLLHHHQDKDLPALLRQGVNGTVQAA